MCHRQGGAALLHEIRLDDLGGWGVLANVYRCNGTSLKEAIGIEDARMVACVKPIAC